MKCFLVGATGYVGASLSEHAPSTLELIKVGRNPEENDILLDLEQDIPPIDWPIAEGDIVILTAAISSPDQCAVPSGVAYRVNVESTSTLIDALLSKGARVLFFSSDAVYGDAEVPVDEGSPVEPYGAYAEMKHLIEQKFSDRPNFKVIRLSYVFSKHDRFTGFVRRCAEEGRTVEAFQPFDRSVIWLNDVVRGVYQVVEAWSSLDEQIINFGGPDTLSRVKVAEIYKQEVDDSLSIAVSEPPNGFFDGRAKVIAMRSPILSRLLSGKLTTIRDAMKAEFYTGGER